MYGNFGGFPINGPREMKLYAVLGLSGGSIFVRNVERSMETNKSHWTTSSLLLILKRGGLGLRNILDGYSVRWKGFRFYVRDAMIGRLSGKRKSERNISGE